MQKTTRFLLCLAAALLVLPAGAAVAHGKHQHGKHSHWPNWWPKHKPPVNVQLLSFNDFHGALEPPTGSAGRVTENPGGTPVDAGGAAFFATHVRNYEAENPNTLLVSAGDLIGASPLVSALFHDEPTIEAMNEIGLDLNAVGNHEFDEGAAELSRMQQGGCHPVDGCQGKESFDGADFGFLAANVVNKRTGRPLFAPYAVRSFQGERVGFIGLTLEATPSIVSPAGIVDWTFLDEADTINKYARILRKRERVKSIVVLLHEGGAQDFTLPRTPALLGVNSCEDFGGPIVDIVNRTTHDVDLFLTGHTHQAYNCVVDERPVTSAMSNGRLITDVDLQISRRTHDVEAISVNNEVVTRTVAVDPVISALIERYKTAAAPIANRVIGQIAETISTAAAPSGETPMGLVIADAQLAATDNEQGAVAAFMNPGGVRAPLTYDGTPPAPADVTYQEAFTVQPFGNNLVTLTLTGEQLLLLLEQQWCGQTGSTPRIMQPSASVAYTWDQSNALAAFGQPCGGATPQVVSDVAIGGAPVTAGGSYRITVNSFMADGGDDYKILPSATDRVGGVVDLDAFEAYLGSLPAPLTAPATNRITVVP